MSLQQPLYRYAPLPANSIRLLRLLPHQDEYVPIKCQLFNCALESSGSCRPYEALSYVWGSGHKSESISLDGYNLPIGENLFAALLHLRHRSIERILWIDALCINQQDTKEKGHQVQSMAKIYATATRVIVWLGKATPDIHQSFEVIRIAGFTAKQPTITTRDKNAILRVLMAPWFRRIWVLQEVAAARHVVVKCGHAEIDGYAFFQGLGVFKLPHNDYSSLRLLVLSVAYLAKGAAFRPRCATKQAGRFSLDICPLAQLVDMFHGRQASDPRDKIYALLGMCSDDPSITGLLVDYNVSWAIVFQQCVNSILSGALSVDTWDNSELAVIKIKGCVLGKVFSFSSNVDREGKQGVGIHWKHGSLDEGKVSYLYFRPSGETVKAGDAICLLQGATLPTIIRICRDYWKIITIAAPLPENPKGSGSDGLLNDFSLPAITTYPHDLLLVWDWNIEPEKSQGGGNYEDLVSHLASTGPQSGLQNNLDRVTRFWHSGVAMRSLNRPIADENLRCALETLEGILGGLESQWLTDPGQACSTKRDEVMKLQGIVGLLLDAGFGHIPLCMAAGNGYEAVVKLLLDTGKIDPDAKDVDNQTPLWRAAKNGYTAIVKLLLDTCKVDPDMGCYQLGHRAFYRNIRTPVSVAAENGHEAIVRLLIDTGKIDFDTWNSRWDPTPLRFAAMGGHPGVVKLLLNTGKTKLGPTQDEATRNSSERALRAAAIGRHKEIVEILLKAGIMGYDRLLLWAEDYGDKEIIKLVRSVSPK